MRPLRLSQAKAASSAKEVATRPGPADARRLRAARLAVLACSSSPMALRRAAVSCAPEKRALAGLLSPSPLQRHTAGGRPAGRREQGHMARPAAGRAPPPPPASPEPSASSRSERLARLLWLLLPRPSVTLERTKRAALGRASHAG